MKNQLAVLCVMAGALVFTSTTSANEPGWTRRIVTFGDHRQEIQSMPIIYRKYRPLHFYGNTVRRAHYRGTPIIAPRDVTSAARVLIQGEL